MASSVSDQFLEFRAELDAKHDKWERLVKISRDITVESKRTIFVLHRVDILNPDLESRSKIINEAESKIASLSKKWRQIAIELYNYDARLFLRAYSPGLQEYIEALAFLYYLRHESDFNIDSISGCVIPLVDVEKKLCFKSEDQDHTMSIPIPATEFLLGIADTTGEIMRSCINAAAKATTRQSKNQVYKLSAFIRLLHEMFSTFASIVEDSSSRRNILKGKLDVMQSSLHKVEECCYQLGIRDSELLDAALRRSHQVHGN